MKQLLFFLFIISLNTYSQSIEIGEIKNINKTVVDYEKKELYVFYKDSLTIIDLDNLKKISNSKIISPIDISFLGHPVSVKSKIHFINTSGGMVYRLEGNEIKRIDNSFDHKMQINSYIFSYNDTIYRYGGYGFWSQRNFFTFFDKENFEWDVVLPTGSKVLPNGSQSSTVKIYNNDFYVYGGVTLNKFNPLEYLINDEVWKFNVKDKSWIKLGTIKIDINKFNPIITFNDKHIYTDESQLMYLVDVVHNKLKSYKKTSINRRILLNDSFYINGVFYFFTWKPSSTIGEILLVSRNEDYFFGELVKEEPFYYNNERIYYIIGLILLVLISVFSYFKIKKWIVKRKRIITVNGNLVFNRHILNFDEKSIQIVNLLLKSEKEIISKDILDIVENPNLNYGHNTRVMNGFIDEINYKLKSTLGIKEDLITCEKSDLDKRIKVYSIDKSYFFIK